MMIKEKSPLRLRHEYKHCIHAAEGQVLSSRLRKLLRHDLNADSHGIYRVSSLYFDTPEDRALRQKIDGVNHREKFRIRYYNGDLTFIRLEKKIKTGSLCGKLSAPLTKEETKNILFGDIDFLLQKENPLLLELYSKMKGQLLRPRTIVTYDREAFLYEPGNVRVTIDRNLRTGFRSLDFLNPDFYHADVSESLRVLEVKYDAFLPELIQMAVEVPNRQSSPYSKYAVCRRYD